MATGFQSSIQGLSIIKDTEAQLFYTLDWVDWLPQGDALLAADWTISARVNDPDPLIKESDGITGTKTYIELSNGQVDKTYTVTVKITTQDGLIDRRHFRVKIQDRSA
jgi:hypothetical protein